MENNKVNTTTFYFFYNSIKTLLFIDNYVHAYFVIILIDNMTNPGCSRLFYDHM